MSAAIAKNKYSTWLKKEKWLILIFLIAMGLRFAIGLLNRQANDNHIDVLNLIVSTNKLPVKQDCWECYHPKLYYVVCAVVVKAFGIEDYNLRIVAMQLINVVISFFMLLIFWKFINKLSLSSAQKHLLFALFALNPCLAGINVQGTNDTMAIFWGVLAVYAIYRFFQKMNITWLVILIVALIAGTLSKSSIAVLIVLTSVAFAGKIFFETIKEEKIKATKYFLILVLSVTTIVPFAGGYYNNYKQFHTFNLSNCDKDPPPHFFEKTPVERAGLRSIFEGFFTFRYFDMVRQPYINNEPDNYPLHRTSLWSQLYGRTLFLHFDQWPRSWQSQIPFIVSVGRVLIILGIVPLVIFITGIFINLRVLMLKAWQRDQAYFAAPLNYLCLLITLAYLSASVFFVYNYRDFCSMKSIYIFPGFLAYIKVFSDGYAFFKNQKISKAIAVTLTIIVLFSIVDVGFLLYQLL